MFLIEGEKAALLLDTGFGQGNLKELISGLTQKPLKLVLSHSDRDHIGGCAQFEGEVFLHPAEYERFLQNMPQNRLSLRPLWEDDTIDLGERELTVLHTPGHTPGSIMLLEQETEVLFSGDSIAEGPIYMFGPGRNLEALCASMEQLAKRGKRVPRRAALPWQAAFGCLVYSRDPSGSPGNFERGNRRGRSAGEPYPVQRIHLWQGKVLCALEGTPGLHARRFCLSRAGGK